jgi:hypothetical protein
MTSTFPSVCWMSVEWLIPRVQYLVGTKTRLAIVQRCQMVDTQTCSQHTTQLPVSTLQTRLSMITDASHTHSTFVSREGPPAFTLNGVVFCLDSNPTARTLPTFVSPKPKMRRQDFSAMHFANMVLPRVILPSLSTRSL